MIGRWVTALVLLTASTASAGGMSFTPKSLRVPIQEIGLFDDVTGAHAPLWQCSEWRFLHTGCYVDVMNDKAVAGLFQNALATVPEGAYNKLYRIVCPGGYQAHVQVKGLVHFYGKTLYTTEGQSAPLTDDPHRYGHAWLPLHNCIDWTNLPRPVTLTADKRVAIDIVYFARDVAYAMEGGRIPGGTGIDGLGRTSCVQGAKHALCVNAFDLLAYDGRLHETVETYYVAPETDEQKRAAFAQVHLAFDEQDRFVGGVTQVYFAPGSQVPWPASWGVPPASLGKNPFFMPVQVFSSVSAGVGYLLRTAWGADPPEGGKTYFVTFPNFERRAHEGEFHSPLIQTGRAAYRIYPRSSP